VDERNGDTWRIRMLTYNETLSTPRQELLALAKKFEEAWDHNDAAALAALFTKDAVLVNDSGAVNGRKAIEKSYADMFQKTRFTKHMVKLEQYSPHIIGTAGNEAWMTGEWSLTFQVQNGAPMQWQGHCLDFCVREGDGWKWRVNTWNAAGPPVPATETK
jgi:ketosteroid isomerase-like protein